MNEPDGKKLCSYADYLDQERASPTKHEFLNGEIFAMAGVTPEHARLCVSVSAELRAQLRGRPCAVYSADLRVRVQATGLSTYPDVSVVCGKLERNLSDVL
ncbi:Uma2 family endonuclease [Sorangium sp. So ce1389]|uniref:Uma2 family endonuclease n=1 Tax=Sorangium sp. So ce1389 TaxID=3133336 RepID=UPI003F60B539